MSLFKNYLNKYNYYVLLLLSFALPFTVYLVNLERKLIGGDTSWFALQIPRMSIMVPTGYPTFSILGKIFTLIPIGDLAYRLNLFSAVFGALTSLVLFMALHRLTKNKAISISAVFCVAFVQVFFYYAVRLEFDTLNAFFIALVLLSMIAYRQERSRKYLYFFFACLGLSLTNHPIALFMAPAFLFYIIIIHPKIFKSIKAVLLSILFFILPLLTYAYIPIRSLQGYGPITDIRSFMTYITGGDFGSTIGIYGAEVSLGVLADYLKILYYSYPLAILLIAAAGIVTLFIKDKFLAISLLVALLSNFLIIMHFLPYANPNYIINILILMSLFISMGFLLLKDMLSKLIEKIKEKKKIHRGGVFLEHSAMILLSVFFIFLSSLLFFENFKVLDRSAPESVYLFWEDAVSTMEEGGVVYVNSPASNVGMFVVDFEQKEKNITFIDSTNQEYSVEHIMQMLSMGKPVYAMGNEVFLSGHFDLEGVTDPYYWLWYRQRLRLFQLSDKEDVIKLDALLKTEKTIGIGQPFEIEYRIRNTSGQKVQITSLVLDIKEDIEFLDVSAKGDIRDLPGISAGKYMWVRDDYFIDGSSEISIIILLRALRPEPSRISFAATALESYYYAEDILVDIVSN